MWIGRFIGLLVVVFFVVAVVLNIASLSGADEFVESFGDEEKEEVLETVKQPPAYFASENPVAVTATGDFPTDYFIEDYDGGVSKVITAPSVEAIKYQVSQGNIIIGYLDTSVLNNPYYDSDFKVFVSVIGYSDTHFVTSESGIRNGNGFVYLISDFMKALQASGDQVVAVRYPVETAVEE